MSKGNTGGTILLLAILAAVGFLIYFIIVWAAKVFVYAGYNTFFYLDNLFDFQVFGPIVTWGIWGLLLGSIIGVIVAVKKLKLSKVLILYPIGIVGFLLLIMGFVNKPSQFSDDYNPSPPKIEKTLKNFYITNIDVNFRSGPSVNDPALFIIKQGSEVELIRTGFVDSRNVYWSKIKYNNQEGYLCIKYIDFSRSGY